MPTATIDLNDAGFRQLIDLFVDELPSRVQAIEQALAAGEVAELRRLAHQLKGSAGCYGFGQITAPAAALQSACDTRIGPEELAAACRRLRATCEQAVASHDGAATTDA